MVTQATCLIKMSFHIRREGPSWHLPPIEGDHTQNRMSFQTIFHILTATATVDKGWGRLYAALEWA